MITLVALAQLLGSSPCPASRTASARSIYMLQAMRLSLLLGVLLGSQSALVPHASPRWPSPSRPVSWPSVHPGMGQASTAAARSSSEEAPALSIPPLPEAAAIRRFALPCLGLWLSSPLLSLVDTSAVGLSAPAGRGALQLAALGPATTFCDGAAYLFAFLNVATTSLYASALAEQERKCGAGEGGERGAGASGAAVAPEAVVRRAAKVALVCGLASMALVLVAGRQMLALYIGHAAASDTALLSAATTYVKVRALSLPAALLGGVLQAALLGAKNSAAALVAIAYATATNLVGDAVLVTGCRMGLTGAAVATSVATWVSTLVLVRTARCKLVGSGGLGLAPTRDRRRDAAPAAAAAAIVPPADDAPAARAPTGGRGPAAAAARVSNRSFLGFAAPVLTLIVGKIAAFGFMTHSAAGLGPLPLAAHQIVLALFFFLSPFLEVVSQTTQSFLPAYTPPDDATAQQAQAFRATADALAARLLRLSLGVAACAAAVGAAFTTFGAALLTNDPAVRMAVRPLTLPLTIAVLLTGPVCASEGVLLARRQLPFLAGVYLATVAVLPPALLAIKVRRAPVALVWACFTLFQAFRALLFTGRIWGARALSRGSDESS